MNNKHDRLSDSVRESYKSIEVPDSVSPDNIEGMLENKRKSNDRRYRLITRIVACAAVFALMITGLAVGFGTDLFGKRPEGEMDPLEAKSYSELYDYLYEKSFKGGNLFDGFLSSVARWYAKDGAVVNESSSSTPKPAPDSSQGGEADHSDTNVQVEGVDEADFVKTDGKYIYILEGGNLKIFGVSEREVIGTLTLPEDVQIQEMYLFEDKDTLAIVWIDNGYYNDYHPWYVVRNEPDYEQPRSGIFVIDVSDADSPKLAATSSQTGYYRASRAIDGTVYLISNHYLYWLTTDKDEVDTYVPGTYEGDDFTIIKAKDIEIATEFEAGSVYAVIASYDAGNGTVKDSRALLGEGLDIYCTTDRLFAYGQYYQHLDGSYFGNSYTAIHEYKLNDGEIVKSGSGSVIGYTYNQFSFHYERGHLFVCTTYSVSVESLSAELRETYKDRSSVNANGLFSFDSNMKMVGKLTELGINETVRSARYFGGYCFFVTFRQTDPLFAVDISDPTAMKIDSELKIPGFSAYLHPYAEGLLFGFGFDGDDEGKILGLKLSMFDISDTRAVTEKWKTVIATDAYSEATSNHKAIYVNSTKGIVGVASMSYGYEKVINEYKIYSFDKNTGFTLLASVEVHNKWNANDGYFYYGYDSVRGLHIGDVFYVVSPYSVSAVSLVDYSLLYSIEI